MNRFFEKYGEPVNYLEDALNIKNYIVDGFKCIGSVKDNRVYPDQAAGSTWMFTDVFEEYMFAQHSSWVYMIVDGEEIVKIGETGNPLGIKDYADEPKKGTKCRMGRLRNQGFAAMNSRDTDARIRYELYESVQQNRVTVWALKCEYLHSQQLIGGIMKDIILTSHKQLEHHYLDLIKEECGMLPRLNLGRC